MIDEDEQSWENKHQENAIIDSSVASKKKIYQNDERIPFNISIKHANNDGSASKVLSIRGDTLGRKWLQRYDELISFKKEFRHCRVSQHQIQNKELYVWVVKQRHEYRRKCEGKPSAISEDRIAALEKIGFDWSKGSSYRWDQRFSELVEFKQRHGHCRVLRGDEKTKQLGKWVDSQRQEYRKKCEGKRSYMTAARIKALEHLGFDWAKDVHATWQHRYNQLRIFKQKFGHCSVTASDTESKQLSNWVRAQRHQYRKKCEGKPSALTAERIIALKKIDFH